MEDTTLVNPNQEQVEFWLDEAFCFRELGQTDRALAICDEALQISPENAEVHNLVGLLHEDKNDLEGAVEAFQRAIEHDPEFEDARLNLKDAERSLEAEAQHLQPVAIAEHIRNGLVFGGLFFIAGCLLHYLRGLGNYSSGPLRYMVVEFLYGNFFLPILLSIFATIGLYIFGRWFNINHVWKFALLGGIGCVIGGTILGGLVSSAYYTVVGLPTIEGIPVYNERGPIGYTMGAGLFMGILSGFALHKRTILASLFLGIVGAVGFGAVEYLHGFDILLSLAGLVYSALSSMNVFPYPDIWAALDSADGLGDAQLLFGISLGLFTGAAGIILGILMSVVLAHLVGSRDSWKYSVLEENTI